MSTPPTWADVSQSDVCSGAEGFRPHIAGIPVGCPRCQPPISDETRALCRAVARRAYEIATEAGW